MEINPRSTPILAGPGPQQENHDTDYSFTPVANGKKNPRAWERKLATPFNPRFKEHKVWKRYELRSKKADDEPNIRAAERKPSGRAVKRLRKDDSLLRRGSHKPYVDMMWDEAAESGRRKYARRRSAVKPSPSKPLSPSKSVNMDLGNSPTRSSTPTRAASPSKVLNLGIGSSPARNGTPTRVRSPVKRIVPPRLFSPTAGSSPARNGTPARHTSPAKDVDHPVTTSPLKAWSPSKRKTPGKKIASSRLSPVKAMALSNASSSMFGLIPFRRPSPERELPSSPAETSDVSANDESSLCDTTSRMVTVLFSPPTGDLLRDDATPQSPTYTSQTTTTDTSLTDTRRDTLVIDKHEGPIIRATQLHISERMGAPSAESPEAIAHEQDRTSPSPSEELPPFDNHDTMDSVNIMSAVFDAEGSAAGPNFGQHDDMDLNTSSPKEVGPMIECDEADSPSRNAKELHEIHTSEILESRLEFTSSTLLPMPVAMYHDGVIASPIVPTVEAVDALQEEQDSSTLSSLETELSDEEVSATSCSEPVAQVNFEEHVARVVEERPSPTENSQNSVPSLALRTDECPVLVDAAEEEAPLLRSVSNEGENMGVAEAAQGDSTKAPSATSIITTLSEPRKFSDSLHDDDTALLKSFLSRAQAKKAAAAAATPNQEMTSPRKGFRKTLGEVDNNSVSPQKVDSHPKQATKSESRDMTVTEAKDLAEPHSRRSVRSRTPKPIKVEKDAPSAIPVRRTDGAEHHVILQKSEAQELALTTRANTKLNRGGAKHPKFAMKELTLAPIEDQEPQNKKKVGSKAVSWDETLAYFGRQDTVEEEQKEEASKEEAPKDEVQPPTRKLRRLGAVNGTPAPKKLTMAPLPSPKKASKEIVGTPGPKRRGRSRV